MSDQGAQLYIEDLVQTMSLRHDRGGLLSLHEPRGYIHHWHAHHEYEFNLILKGSGTYIVGQERIPMQANSLLWLPVLETHRLIETSPDFRMWVAVLLPDDVELPFSDTDCPPHCVLPNDEAARLNRLCEECNENKNETAYHKNSLRFIFSQARKYLHQHAQDPNTSLPPLIHEALSLLDSHPHYSSEALADACGVSRSHLSRVFHQELGCTLVQYRNRQRLEHVKRLLHQEPNYSLLAAATQAGFGSYAQFHRVVQQELNCTPRDLANEISTIK